MLVIKSTNNLYDIIGSSDNRTRASFPWQATPSFSLFHEENWEWPGNKASYIILLSWEIFIVTL